MAVVAPMPRAKGMTTTAVKPGDRASWRRARRRSPSMSEVLEAVTGPSERRASRMAAAARCEPVMVFACGKRLPTSGHHARCAAAERWWRRRRPAVTRSGRERRQGGVAQALGQLGAVQALRTRARGAAVPDHRAGRRPAAPAALLIHEDLAARLVGSVQRPAPVVQDPTAGPAPP